MLSKFLVPLALATPLVTVLAQEDAADAAPKADPERAAVERAVLDYAEAFYDVKPELLARSVHPDLDKRGWFRSSPEEPYSELPMTYEQLVELAKRFNKEGRLPADAPKEVEVLDLLDQTASAKLVAAWGVDYLHLAKYDGVWRIRQVLWQSVAR